MILIENMVWLVLYLMSHFGLVEEITFCMVTSRVLVEGLAKYLLRYENVQRKKCLSFRITGKH